MNDLNSVQEEILKFLRNLNSVEPEYLKKEFRKLRDRLIIIQKQPYQRRAFLYLDIIGWLESKIKEISVQDIIKQRFQR